MTTYTRINLHETNYTLLENAEILTNPEPRILEKIYNDYCIYKQFKSVMPIFPEEYTDPKNDVIGYYDQGCLVAFSLVRRYNSKNAEAIQFAWNYSTPMLHLGIKSLRHECALYKSMGFDYYYIGEVMEYKKKIDGFEILPPRHQTRYQ